MQKLLPPILLLLLLPVWTVAQDAIIGITQDALDAIERGEIVAPPEVIAAIESGNIRIYCVSEFVIPERDPELVAQERAMMEFVTNRVIKTAFDNDPSGALMMLLATIAGQAGAESFLPSGFREEFGISDEQLGHAQELMNARMLEYQERFEAMRDEFVEAMESVETKVKNGDFTLTEEEEALVDLSFRTVLEVSNVVALESFTDEQIKKLDGMILALTGGLESPFFNERHMAAIEMTDEQRAQFKAIDEALKPERDQMIAALSKEVMRMTESGEISFNGLVTTLSQFRGFSRELRQRRMGVLTAAQVTRVRQLTRLPDFLSVRHLLPQWMPGPGSWQPGDPLPEGAAPRQPQPRNFPRDR